MDPKVILVICVAFLFTAGCTTQPSQPGITPVPSMLPPTLLPATPAATTPQEPVFECRIAEDCEPAECCHPTSCVRKGLRTPCDDVYCTMVCSGPLDCGAGSCGCVQGKCSVVPRSEPRYAPAVYTGVTIVASPPRYSPVMSSTPGVGLELTAIGFPPADATFTWNATYGHFLSWNAPDYRVNELGDSTTNNGEKLYWSFTGKPASTATPVTITVTATENGSGRILGSESVTLAWDGNDVVVVKE
jgi:hypothetical protein